MHCNQKSEIKLVTGRILTIILGLASMSYVEAQTNLTIEEVIVHGAKT